jgi:D-alanyl-D-alanine carboxypeptidase
LVLIPKALVQGQQVLVGSVEEVPDNNVAIAGIQKYTYPPTALGIPAPYISAHSSLVLDLTTDTVLFQKFPDIKLPIASTTKIMTALVAVEHFQPSDPLTSNIGATISGSRIGLSSGEVLTFKSLLYGMLLNSGNDGAFTIAENYPGGVGGFVVAMNKKVTDLGLVNTHFDNPAGFDSPNHYSSAADLAAITKEALKHPELVKVFATKETEVLSIDKRYDHKLTNLNKLLSSVQGVLGVKTGFTDIAKENLVGLVERDNHRVLTVVLGSDDRFGETTKLIEWTYQNFSWK